MDEPIEWPSAPPTVPPPIGPSTVPPTGPPIATALPPPPPEEHRHPVASPWSRVGGLGLEALLMACTLGFGWVGWWIIAWGDGQTPSKVVLHLHVVTAKDGQLASFGRMALREVLGKAMWAVAILAGAALGLWWLSAIAALYVVVNAAVAATDVRRRTLWDRLAGTVVVEGDPPVAPVPVPAPPVMAPMEAGSAPG